MKGQLTSLSCENSSDTVCTELYDLLSSSVCSCAMHCESLCIQGGVYTTPEATFTKPRQNCVEKWDGGHFIGCVPISCHLTHPTFSNEAHSTAHSTRMMSVLVVVSAPLSNCNCLKKLCNATACWRAKSFNFESPVSEQVWSLYMTHTTHTLGTIQEHIENKNLKTVPKTQRPSSSRVQGTKNGLYWVERSEWKCRRGRCIRLHSLKHPSAFIPLK